MSPAKRFPHFCLAGTIAAIFLAASATAEPAHTQRSAKRLASQTRLVTEATPKVSVEELYSRGDFAMQVGQNGAAIAEFEQVLKSRPEHTAAWGKLAFLYLKQGESQKAMQAFKKAKGLGDANGGVVTRNGSRGLQLQ